jgi:two-component system sensor histidine kinase DctS
VTAPELDVIDHVLRGSLNTALLNLQLLEPALENDREGRASLEKAREALRRLAEVLIPASLDIVALEVREPQCLALRPLVERALARAGLAGVALQDAPWPSVTADPALLEVAVVHLARNALAATPPGADGPRLGAEARGDFVDILLRDRGGGISFRRAGHPPRPGHLGGLVAVARIARLHRGAITFEPHPEGGSLARLSLPAGARWHGACSSDRDTRHVEESAR